MSFSHPHNVFCCDSFKKKVPGSGFDPSCICYAKMQLLLLLVKSVFVVNQVFSNKNTHTTIMQQKLTILLLQKLPSPICIRK
jgi:hypothetical protein